MAHAQDAEQRRPMQKTSPHYSILAHNRRVPQKKKLCVEPPSKPHLKLHKIAALPHLSGISNPLPEKSFVPLKTHLILSACGWLSRFHKLKAGSVVSLKSSGNDS